MSRSTRALVGALATAAVVAGVPAAASASAGEKASCAGQFASGAPPGPQKGEFASENAKGDGRNFGTVTSTLFARGEVCPF